MKKSEELMLLLDYNDIDVSAYHLREQLDYEIKHPNSLMLNPSLEELALLKYQGNNAYYYLLNNPLMYHHTWPDEITSIEQFYVQPKESKRIVTIKEIINNPAFKGAGLKRILQDIFSKYLYEYDEAYKKMIKQVKNMYHLLPKKQMSHIKVLRKKWVTMLVLFLLVGGIFLVENNEFFDFVYGYEALSSIAFQNGFIYSATMIIGQVFLLVSLVFFMIHYAFKSLINDVEKREVYHREFDEEMILEDHQAHLNKMMLNIQLYISKIEDDKQPNKDLLSEFDYENTKLRSYKENLYKTHRSNDTLQRRKSFFLSALKRTFYVALVLSTVFLISIISIVLIEVINNV